MENAAKALLIAAGVLIGVLIMSLFAYEMLYVSNNAREYQTEMQTTQIAEFNSQFEIYANKETITAQEVITLYSYIQEWNIDNISTPITLSRNTTNSLDLKRLISGTITIEEFLDQNYDKSFECELRYDDNGIAARVNEVIIREKYIL